MRRSAGLHDGYAPGMSLMVLLTPWYRRGPARTGREDHPGSTAATRILDYDAPGIRHLVRSSQRLAGEPGELATLASAHAIIRDEVRPVYALNEATPTSRTLARGFGSCSQRLAILESVARAIGVGTRVRALLVDRSFWYPRFPRIGGFLPDQIVLAWPEFLVDDWRSSSELFGPIGCRGGHPFTNTGTETLFEAAGRCAVDWDGRETGGAYDLSRFVVADHGYFGSRDELFACLGQTLCAPARVLADPVLRRFAAGTSPEDGVVSART